VFSPRSSANRSAGHEVGLPVDDTVILATRHASPAQRRELPDHAAGLPRDKGSARGINLNMPGV